MLSVLNKTANRLFSHWATVVAAALFFTLIMRLLTLEFPDDLSDSKYYVDAARRMFGALHSNFNQYNSRLGIMFPLYFIIRLAGGAAAYYILPLLYSLLACFLVLKSAKLLNKTREGFIAALLLAAYPSMGNLGSQILPDIFSMVYLLAAFYFALKYIFKKENMSYIVLAAIFVFFAYETHVINMFFSLGVALMLVLNKPEVKRAPIIFFAILLALYLAETLIYGIFTEYSFGRLEAIRCLDAGVLRQGALWSIFFVNLIKGYPLFLALFALVVCRAAFFLSKKNYAKLSLCLPVLCLAIAGFFSMKAFSPDVLPPPVNAALPFIILLTVFFAAEYLSVARIEQLAVTACVLIPVLTAAVGYKNIARHPLPALISLDSEFGTSIKEGIPFIYSPEDSASFVKYENMSYAQKQRIDFDFVLGIPNPDYKIAEEYKKIRANIDYINAFFAPDGVKITPTVAFLPDNSIAVKPEKMLFKPTAAFLPDGSALLCVLRELALTFDWSEYLADPENPLMRLGRHPLSLEKIQGTQYENPNK
jgi:hypothetical protein